MAGGDVCEKLWPREVGLALLVASRTSGEKQRVCEEKKSDSKLDSAGHLSVQLSVIVSAHRGFQKAMATTSLCLPSPTG